MVMLATKNIRASCLLLILLIYLFVSSDKALKHHNHEQEKTDEKRKCSPTPMTKTSILGFKVIQGHRR